MCVCVCGSVCECARAMDIKILSMFGHNPNNLHTKLTRPMDAATTIITTASAATPQRPHTPRVKKPKQASTKISLVMKDIKSKSQQLRHEIEASRWKQSPEQLLVGQKWWATMDATPLPSSPSLPLSLSVTPLTFLLRSASRSLNLSIHLVRSACSFRCWPKTFATDSTWKAAKFRRCLSLLSSPCAGGEGAAFLGQVACKREQSESREKQQQQQWKLELKVNWQRAEWQRQGKVAAASSLSTFFLCESHTHTHTETYRNLDAHTHSWGKLSACAFFAWLFGVAYLGPQADADETGESTWNAANAACFCCDFLLFAEDIVLVCFLAGPYNCATSSVTSLFGRSPILAPSPPPFSSSFRLIHFMVLQGHLSFS